MNIAVNANCLDNDLVPIDLTARPLDTGGDDEISQSSDAGTLQDEVAPADEETGGCQCHAAKQQNDHGIFFLMGLFCVGLGVYRRKFLF